MNQEFLERSTILDQASRKGQIIYGQRSQNEQLGFHLQRKTKDYDILTKNPKKAAKFLAERLNKSLNGDYDFKPATHKGTWRVFNKVTGESLVDYTQKTKSPQTTNILGVKYAKLSYSKRKAQKSLRNPLSKFRHEKDLKAIKSIKEVEKAIW